MTDNYAPTHHQTTSDINNDNSAPTNKTFGDWDEYRQQDSTTRSDRPFATNQQGDNIEPADAAASSDYRPRLNSEYEPRTEVTQKRDSLASTQGPFQTPTTDDVSKSDIPPTSSVSQQNAPHKGGQIGEAAMSALGYGGTGVERPKEEQGLAEKIVNLMGA